MKPSLKKTALRYSLLTLVYGTFYMLCEIIWKGGFDQLHLSMFILAAYGGITVAKSNNHYTYEMDILWQCLIGGITVTILEGLVGHTFNTDYSIWDYRHLPFSFWNSQINIFFSLTWTFLLCPLAVLIDDALAFYILKTDERPYYKCCGKVLFYMPEKKKAKSKEEDDDIQ